MKIVIKIDTHTHQKKPTKFLFSFLWQKSVIFSVILPRLSLSNKK